MFYKLLLPFTNQNACAISKAILCRTKTPSMAHNLEQVRYAARKGTRAAALAAKKARKLKEGSKPAPIPKHLLRKAKASPEMERQRCTDENWLEASPIDNVYDMNLYRGRPYRLVDALAMHRQTHGPSMLNDASAPVFADIELDLKLKKKDRFLEELSGIVTYPHKFAGLKKNRVVVVCKSEEEQSKASDAGAIYAGSTALIKQILNGSIQKDEFDYLVCHPDMYKEAGCLRGILAKKFPNTFNGLLRLDIEPAVRSFIDGIEYGLKRSSIEPGFGWVDICFGRLNMPDDQLDSNLKHALSSIEKHKPPGTEHQLFIIRTRVRCDKSREMFKIPHWDYLTHYPENGLLKEGGEEVEESVKEESG